MDDENNIKARAAQMSGISSLRSGLITTSLLYLFGFLKPIFIMMSVVPVFVAIFAIAAAQHGQFQFPYPFAFQQPAFTQQSAFSSFPAFPQAHAAFPAHPAPAPAAAVAPAQTFAQQQQAAALRFNPAAEQQLAHTIVQHYHNDQVAQMNQLRQLEQIKAGAALAG